MTLLRQSWKPDLANLTLDKVFLMLLGVVAAAGYGYGLTHDLSLIILVGAPFAVLIAVAASRWPQVAAVILLVMSWGFLSDTLVKFHNVPSPMYGLSALLFGALVVRRFGRKRVPLVYSPMNWMLLAWLLLVLLGFWYGTFMGVVEDRLIELCKNLLFYLLLVNLITTRESFMRAMWLLLVVGAVLGSLSVYQEATHNYRNNYGGLAHMQFAYIADGLDNRPRASGTTASPLAYGQQLIVLVPIGLWGMVRGRRLFSKLFATYATTMCFAGIGLTFSRATYLVLILILAMFAVYIRLNWKQILVIIPILLGLIAVAPSDFTARYATISELAPGDKGVYTDKSTLTRSVEMKMAWYMFLDHPLLGVGSGNYAGLYQTYIRREGAPVDDAVGNPHNMYLEVASEEGGIGIIVFAVILFYTMYQYIKAALLFRAAGDPLMSSLAATLFIAFIGYCGTAMFFQASYPRFLWLQVAMATTIFMLAQRAIQAARQPAMRVAVPPPPAMTGGAAPAGTIGSGV